MENLDWLARFNTAFPPYPKKPGAHLVAGRYMDRDTCNTLKEFFLREIGRAERKAETGEVEEEMDMGNYRLPTSLSGRPERVG